MFGTSKHEWFQKSDDEQRDAVLRVLPFIETCKETLTTFPPWDAAYEAWSRRGGSWTTHRHTPASTASSSEKTSLMNWKTESLYERTLGTPGDPWTTRWRGRLSPLGPSGGSG